MVRIPTGKIRVNRRIFGLIHQYILMDQSILCAPAPMVVSFPPFNTMDTQLPKAHSFDIIDALQKRILIIDGALGTMVKQLKLRE